MENIIASEIIIQMNKEYLELKNSEEYRLGSKLLYISSLLRDRKIGELRNYVKIVAALKKEKRKWKWESRFQEKKDISNNYKIAIYTVIFGKYDSILEPFVLEDNCDYYIVTDQEIPQKSIWEKKNLEFIFGWNNMTNAEKNRYCKMHGNEIFDTYDYNIYIDGNLQLYGKISSLIKYVDNTTEIAMFNHPQRSCIYDEGSACLIFKKGVTSDIKKQLQRYRNEGMPCNYGMCECSVVVRKRGILSSQIMQAWWEEFKKGECKRDQLSFPYVLWKKGISINRIGCLGDCCDKHPLFRRVKHLI